MRTVKLADIRVTYRGHEIPLTCPQCGADLCAKEAFKTWEYSCDSAHVTVEADGTVGANDCYDWDYGAGDNFIPHALTCATCSLEIAGGGYREDGDPNPGRTIAGPSKGYQDRAFNPDDFRQRVASHDSTEPDTREVLRLARDLIRDMERGVGFYELEIAPEELRSRITHLLGDAGKAST